MKKPKFLISVIGYDLFKDSGKYPCAVCRKGVGSNCIACSQCKLWVQKKCCGISGRLVANPEYVCPRCTRLSRPIDGRPSSMIDVGGTTLDVEPTFCYLGDMLGAGGGCDSAIAARVCSA